MTDDPAEGTGSSHRSEDAAERASDAESARDATDRDEQSERSERATQSESPREAPDGRIESTQEFRRVFADVLKAVPAEHVDEARFVPGVGPRDADVVLVGEAPGADEVEEGRPFVGAAGRRLDSALDELDVDRDELYVTNVVKVRPPENRTPRVGEIDAWKEVFDAELAMIGPAVVVPLGTTATQAVLDTDEGVTALRGDPIEADEYTVLPTFHPAATFYDDSKVETIEADLDTVFDLAE